VVFSSYIKLRHVKKRQHFVESGQVCKELAFILSGSVRLYHVKDGAEITGYFSIDNEFICSYKSFLKQVPSIPNIQAVEELLLLTLSYEAVQALLNDPVTALKIERLMRHIAEQLIFCYEDRVESFVTQSPEERYTTLLQNNPQMLRRVPQHYLANYLGMTATSLSRIRKRLFESTH
jgi:CRP-like cAMP-binding protein